MEVVIGDVVAGQGVGRQDAHGGGDAGHRFQVAVEAGGKLLVVADVARRPLDLDGQMVEMVFTPDTQLVLAADVVILAGDGLDSARDQVDSLDAVPYIHLTLPTIFYL